VWETRQVHLFHPRYARLSTRTCPAASRVQFNPPSTITPLTNTLQPTTRSQRPIPRSTLTPSADAYCYDEEPRHSRPYTLFPTLGHTHLSLRRRCPLLPSFPIACAPALTPAAAGVRLTCHCDVACGEGPQGFQMTSMVRLLVRRLLGHVNGPQAFVCVYERAWHADEESAEGV